MRPFAIRISSGAGNRVSSAGSAVVTLPGPRRGLQRHAPADLDARHTADASRTGAGQAGRHLAASAMVELNAAIAARTPVELDAGHREREAAKEFYVSWRRSAPRGSKISPPARLRSARTATTWLSSSTVERSGRTAASWPDRYATATRPRTSVWHAWLRQGEP